MIIKIEAYENGGHDNQSTVPKVLPDGWAVIPNSMATDNFPFGEVVAEEIDGVMTVTSWTPGEIPAAPAPAPAEQREKAYNEERLIEWNGDMLTVTEAATLWQYYAAEGSEKAQMLTTLIVKAKEAIRGKYPEN